MMVGDYAIPKIDEGEKDTTIETKKCRIKTKEKENK
jgi:hypothetical protein